MSGNPTMTGHTATTSARARGASRGNPAPTSRGRARGRGLTARVAGTSQPPRNGTAYNARGSGTLRASRGTSLPQRGRGRGFISRTFANPAPSTEGMTAPAASHKDFMNQMTAKLQVLKQKRESERAVAIREGFLADPEKKTSLDKAITPVGTCIQMCPEFERVERIVQNMVDKTEKIQNDATGRDIPSEDRMIKRFRRSAAGYDEQLPSDIRTPATLQTTLDYLLEKVISSADRLASVHKFVWDRTRGIRNDFSIQQVTRLEDVIIAVDCFERIARFHILSLHLLAKPDYISGEHFEAHQDREQLNNTLLSLMYYYDDNRQRHSFPNEAEFRTYCILFELQSQHPDLEDRMQSWPANLLNDKKIQTAFYLYSAAGNTSLEQGPLRPLASFVVAQGNSGSFWATMESKSVSYLMACTAEIYFGQVRLTTLQSLWKAAKRAPVAQQTRSQDWKLSDLTRILAFDTEEETLEFCESLGLKFGSGSHGVKHLDVAAQVSLDGFTPPSQQIFSNNMVESKRHRRSLRAVISGFSVSRSIKEGLVEAAEELDIEDIEDIEDTEMDPTDSNDNLFIPEQTSSSSRFNPTGLNPTANPFNPQYGQSQPSLRQSQPVIFGKPQTPAFGQSLPGVSGKSKHPIFGEPQPPTFGQSQPAAFVQSKPPLFGQPQAPLVGQSQLAKTEQGQLPTFRLTEPEPSGQNKPPMFKETQAPLVGQIQPATTGQTQASSFGQPKPLTFSLSQPPPFGQNQPAAITSANFPQKPATSQAVFASNLPTSTGTSSEPQGPPTLLPVTTTSTSLSDADPKLHFTAGTSPATNLSPNSGFQFEFKTNFPMKPPSTFPSTTPLNSSAATPVPPFTPFKRGQNLGSQIPATTKDLASPPMFAPQFSANEPRSTVALGPPTSETAPASTFSFFQPNSRHDDLQLGGFTMSSNPAPDNKDLNKFHKPLNFSYTSSQTSTSQSLNEKPADHRLESSNAFPPATQSMKSTSLLLPSQIQTPAPGNRINQVSSTPKRTEQISFTKPRNEPSPIYKTQLGQVEAVDMVSQIALLQPGGLMQQYLEFMLPSLLAETQMVFDAEKENRIIKAARTTILSKKYFRRWRTLAWRNTLNRRAQVRRQAFAEAAKHREKSVREAAELQKILQAAREAQRIRLEQQERRLAQTEEAATATKLGGIKRKSIHVEHLENSANAETPRKILKGHARSRTVGHANDPTLSGLHRSAPGLNHSSPIQPLRSSVPPSQLSIGSRGSFSGRKVDSTQTDYFRLKALGIDPDTPLIPDTKSSLELKRRKLEAKEAELTSKKGRLGWRAPMNEKVTVTSSLESSPAILEQTSSQQQLATKSVGEDDDKILSQIREMRAAMTDQTDWFRTQTTLLEKEIEQQQELTRSTGSRDSPQLSASGLARANGYEYLPAQTAFGRSISKSEQRIRMTGAHGLATKPIGGSPDYLPVAMSKKTALLMDSRSSKQSFVRRTSAATSNIPSKSQGFRSANSQQPNSPLSRKAPGASQISPRSQFTHVGRVVNGVPRRPHPGRNAGKYDDESEEESDNGQAGGDGESNEEEPGSEGDNGDSQASAEEVEDEDYIDEEEVEGGEEDEDGYEEDYDVVEGADEDEDGEEYEPAHKPIFHMRLRSASPEGSGASAQNGGVHMSRATSGTGASADDAFVLDSD